MHVQVVVEVAQAAVDPAVLPPRQPEVQARRDPVAEVEHPQVLARRHPEDPGDDDDRQQGRVALDEVERLAGADRGEAVEQLVSDALDLGPQPLDRSGGEDLGHEAAGSGCGPAARRRTATAGRWGRARGCLRPAGERPRVRREQRLGADDAEVVAAQHLVADPVRGADVRSRTLCQRAAVADRSSVGYGSVAHRPVDDQLRLRVARRAARPVARGRRRAARPTAARRGAAWRGPAGPAQQGPWTLPSSVLPVSDTAGTVPHMTSEARRRRARQVRERLIAAAAGLFAEQGYESTSLDQVAATAGFTKGAVYSNFASKDELFLDAHGRARRAAGQQVREALAVAAGPRPHRPARRRPADGGVRRGQRLAAAVPGLRAARRAGPGVREHFVAHSRRVRALVNEAVREVRGTGRLQGLDAKG